jgi:hypothetical protein
MPETLRGHNLAELVLPAGASASVKPELTRSSFKTLRKPTGKRGMSLELLRLQSLAHEHFAWIDALSESNLCVALALPVSEHLRTPSTGKASATH